MQACGAHARIQGWNGCEQGMPGKRARTTHSPAHTVCVSEQAPAAPQAAQAESMVRGMQIAPAPSTHVSSVSAAPPLSSSVDSCDATSDTSSELITCVHCDLPQVLPGPDEGRDVLARNLKRRETKVANSVKLQRSGQVQARSTVQGSPIWHVNPCDM